MTKSSTTIDERARLGSGAMFDSLAPRYDLLNRLMSFGADKRWRRATWQSLKLPTKAEVLDLATGTADLAIAVARKHPDAQVVGLDPSAEMLRVGHTKLARRRLEAQVELVEGVAEDLPFADKRFDGVSMAFGIRNCVNRKQALAEIHRVTRPGGRVAILELGEPRKGLIAPLARFHIHHIVPRLGALLSGSREYRYLQTSIEAFPSSDKFADMLRGAGFEGVEVRAFSFGACHLYTGGRSDSN